MPKFKFIRGAESDDKKYRWPDGAEDVRMALRESLNARNISFLLGAGCSSYLVDGEEVGVPTMPPLAKEFTEMSGSDDTVYPTAEELEVLMEQFGIDITAEEYTNNLERLMEILFSLRFVLESSSLEKADSRLIAINSMIKKVQTFLWNKCTNAQLVKADNPVMLLYESFYRKLVLRDRSLPRPWVFTTNYDLFNEIAMDRVGLPYANGFSGVVERRFNPANFRYALAEQLDLTNRKWSAVDGFVYLGKLHGSISWTENDRGLFPIREMTCSPNLGNMMIYPKPATQKSALSSPYSDILREFQSQIVREQSVLFTVGYAFGDEHINNIIYQALTVPTFRLVIFAEPNQVGEIDKLRGLNDSRIWIIGGGGPKKGRKAHYFDTVIEEFMPQRRSEKIYDAIEKMLNEMSPKKEGKKNDS